MHGKVELGVIVIYGTHKLIAATTSICFIIVCKSSTFFRYTCKISFVGTTIFASSKTKSRFYLVIYKNTCTFAAVFVFVRFYIRSDARMVIAKVHNTIGISSDAHSFFFFY